jgi:hypothetical protein
MALTEHEQQDLELKKKDYHLKVVTTLVTAIGTLAAAAGLFLGYCSLSTQLGQAREVAEQTRKRDIEQKEKEFMLKLYGKQIEVYGKACELADRVLSKLGKGAPNADAAFAVGKPFREYYRAYICVFADPEVVNKATEFDKISRTAKTADDLLIARNDLIHQCRKSLMEKFPTLGSLPKSANLEK